MQIDGPHRTVPEVDARPISGPRSSWPLAAMRSRAIRNGVAACVLATLCSNVDAAQVTIDGPAGSDDFGRTVTTLPNGSIVVTDPGFDFAGSPAVDNVGAVYVYRPDGTLISTLRGSSASDQVGSGGVVVLGNGNFVVISPIWNNGTLLDAGAVTFGSAVTGASGVVSSANSLVGGRAFDAVNGFGVTVLANGNYVVSMPFWDSGASTNAGAVTFGSGTTGVSGVITQDNSLVGSTLNDRVGSFGVTALANGNYVVASTLWDNGAVTDAGAVTFGSGTSGVRGIVSPANSLVGSTTNDRVGIAGVLALADGSYVIRSPDWDNGAITNAGAATFGPSATGVAGEVTPANSLVGRTAGDAVGETCGTGLTTGGYVVCSSSWDNGAAEDAGAVTFGPAAAGVSGLVSPVNSLVGSTANDRVGNLGVTALANGNYVVASAGWNNGAIGDVGAATFGSGTTGVIGVISPANSLVGSTSFNQVGSYGVTPLANGNYVVRSPNWDNGPFDDAGAVTFGSGTTGISGVVSPANSLVGSAEGDAVGNIGVTALTNGNYVVTSPSWANGAIIGAGAATFGSGTTGVSGEISPLNSLVGTKPNDRVGRLGATALIGGGYLVISPEWANGAITRAGAVTFGSGTAGVSGVVSPANSLVGSTPADAVGQSGVIALANGGYVISSLGWDNGALTNVGAVTFGSGVTGTSGVISPVNSVVGNTPGDIVGSGGVTALGNGNYVVDSEIWDNGSLASAGAITLGLSDGSVAGPVSDIHSVLGTVADAGFLLTFNYDAERNQLAVGQPASNRVVLLRTGIATSVSIVGNTPDPSASGQPVTFSAELTATPSLPADGRVRFTASSGESCSDDAPVQASPTTATYACSMRFDDAGVSTVIAEFIGSTLHAYSGSAPESHAIVVDPAVFANGFESP
jgi:hypothetical protein